MKKNIILEKSYKFSLEIVTLYKILISKKEFILSKQLLRSGTSIGANIHESQGSVSRKEFYVKMQIAYKEAFETEFWLNLLKDSNYIDESIYNIYFNQITEIKKILASIQIKMK